MLGALCEGVFLMAMFGLPIVIDRIVKVIKGRK